MLRKYCLVLIACLFLSSFGSSVPISKMYNVELSFSSGNVSLENVRVINGFSNVPGKVFDDSYIIRTVSFENKVYQEFPFRFSYDLFRSVSPDCFVEEGVVELLNCGNKNSYVKLNESIKIISIPFSPNAKFLRVFEPSGRLIIEKDISEFSCGNLVCDDHESKQSCIKDCARGKYFFYKFMLWFSAVLVIIASLLFVFWKYLLREKKFKEKMFLICRCLKKWQN